MPGLLIRTSPRSAIRTSMPGHGRPALVGLASASGWMEISALDSVDPYTCFKLTPMERKNRKVSGPRGAPQAELVPDRAVHEELAEGAAESQADRHRLALRAQDLRLLGRALVAAEHPALQRGRVRGPHLHRGQHVLPDARGGQHRGG